MSKQLEYVQGWRLYNFPGQAVTVFSCPHSKELFPDVQAELPMFQFVSIAPGPVTVHH